MTRIMAILSRFRSAARNLLRRGRVERELDDELRGYVDLLADEKIRSGVAPDAARRAALIKAGGIEQVKEDVRDARGGARLEAFGRDLRHALRGLRRSRASRSRLGRR